MHSQNRLKVAIIEPSPVVREGIKKLLDASCEFHVGALYGDLASFRENEKNASFDVILLNPSIVDCYRQFAAENLFSEFPEAAAVAILYGYVNRDTLESFDGALDIYDEPLTMVKKLRKIAKEVSNKARNEANSVDLSDREKEILVSVAQGLTNKEIAEKHFISIHTVISHRKNISRKTGIKTVSGLTIYAVFNNLIPMS
ncbi:MAG: response regulator transcription factor [Prevotellaceae bacterium]|jgi:DNA-binding NarL/FixJ family response regulator|nr:response regulator transcription factor [Prevotellaceae bacterium]